MNEDLVRLRRELNFYRNKVALGAQLSEKEIQDLFNRLVEAYRAIEEHRGAIEDHKIAIDIMCR